MARALRACARNRCGKNSVRNLQYGPRTQLVRGIYNFNPCGIFEKMTSFCQILNQDLEQGKLMTAVNSRK